MTAPFKIGVIVSPMGTNDGRPENFGILDRDGNDVAWLTYDQVKTALAEFGELQSKWARHLESKLEREFTPDQLAEFKKSAKAFIEAAEKDPTILDG
jgi:hypothetical protein